MLDPLGIYGKQYKTFRPTFIKATTFQATRIAIDTLTIQWLLSISMYMSQCQIVNSLILKFRNIDLVYT